MGWNSASFRGRGTTGQAQNLAMGRDGILTACLVPSRDVLRDRNERNSVKKWDFFLSFLHRSVLEHTFSVLECPFLVLERLFPSFWGVILSFVQGRPRTEEFVPGHLLLPLSWDKGTPGQKNFRPGTKGQQEVKAHPLETLLQP